MDNVVAIQESQVKLVFGQTGGAVGESSEGIEFSDLLQVLGDAREEQDPEKGGCGLENALGDMLSNLINTLPAQVYAELGCDFNPEQQSIAGDQLSAVLGDLAGMLDDAKTGQGVRNGDEVVQPLITLLGAETPGTGVIGTGAIPPAGASAGTQHRGSLLAGEPPPVIPSGVNQAPLIDVPIGDSVPQVKGGVSDAALQIKVDSAAISEDAAGLVTGEAVSRETAAAGPMLSEQLSSNEAVQEKRVGLPENHPDTLPEEKPHPNSTQAQGALPEQENKQAEFKNPGPVLMDDSATTSSATSAPLQTAAPHSFEINSTRGAPGVERAVLEQVMQAVESSSLATDKNKSMLSISLKPEFLGELKLVISVEKGIVNAHFLAQNQLTANLIDSQLPELKQSLSQQGISWQQVTVSLDNGGSGTQSQQGLYQRQDGNVHFAAGEDDFLDKTYSLSGSGIVNYVV